MKTIQAEHKVWVQKKYPNQPPKIPAVGCLEEAGELVHAILKIQLVETWGEDSRHKLPELRAKLVDAIGDCGIFACSLCNANEWDFDTLWRSSTEMYTGDVSVLDVSITLVEHACHTAFDPSEVNYLGYYISQLKAVATKLGLDAEVCTKITWETVKCR